MCDWRRHQHRRDPCHPSCRRACRPGRRRPVRRAPGGARASAGAWVAGGAATLVDPLNTRSLADGIETLLDDRDQAQRQREAGLAQSQRYDWETTARLTLEFYNRVAGG